MRTTIVLGALVSVLAVSGCTTRAELGVGDPSSTATPSSPAALTVQPCTAHDVRARLRPDGEGAGGHVLALVDFRNVSKRRCLLSGYPERVTVHEPGHPTVTATAGSFFRVADSTPMRPGEVTTVGIETRSTCSSHPDGGSSGTRYHQARVSWGGQMVTVRVTRGLDVGCGVGFTRFTDWK